MANPIALLIFVGVGGDFLETATSGIYKVAPTSQLRETAIPGIYRLEV